MPSGKYGLSRNFGQSCGKYNEQSFLDFCRTVSEEKIMPGGLYQPCAFYKESFIKSGGYPEGNICSEGVGAFASKVLRSGDEYYFNTTLSGRQHVTVFDSLVYHIQEGELDE